MAKARRPKIRKGDIFEFELSNGKFAYGQVIISQISLYIIIFREIFQPGEWDVNRYKLLSIALCGWTMDARIYHGMWKVISNAPVPDNIPFPCNKVAQGEEKYIISFDNQIIRPASEEDWQFFDYHTTISPIRFEKAIAAVHGLGDWHDSFNKMRVEYARERDISC